MENAELLNIVTTELIQRRKFIEYDIRREIEKSDGDPKMILDLIREYNLIISDTQLWESLLDDITKPEEGINKN